MQFFKDLDAESAVRTRDHLFSHTEVLRQLQNSAATEATNFLWATNGGAAVALLAFMGSNSSLRSSAYAHEGLVVFFVGIVMLGLLRAINYHKLTTMLNGWIVETDKALASETKLSAPAIWLQRKINYLAWVPALLGYISFACFAFGVLWVVGHFTNQN
jgi:hypothetical protein